MLTYAIGDIHGCLAQLIELIGLCANDANGEPSKFILLGDYIDRGLDSRGVIELLMTLHQEAPERVICLMGNHEDMLLSAVDDSQFEDRWLQNGGEATLRSYGIPSVSDIPKEHIDWLRALPKFHDDGNRFLVHAGVNPDRPLHDQDEVDLLWIRKPFLASDKDFGRLVVHGHTPTASHRPEIHPNRLNIDTGAVFGCPLTTAVFEHGETAPKRFLIARSSASASISAS